MPVLIYPLIYFLFNFDNLYNLKFNNTLIFKYLHRIRHVLDVKNYSYTKLIIITWLRILCFKILFLKKT